MDLGMGGVWGQSWQVDAAGAGGSSLAGLVGSSFWKRGVPVAGAMHLRAEPHLDHLKKTQVLLACGWVWEG